MASYKTVTVDVDVDIDLEEFDDQDLIDELQSRDYIVIDEDDEDEDRMITRIEARMLVEVIGDNQRIGSELWNLREKLFCL